jgi:hypothetical protein
MRRKAQIPTPQKFEVAHQPLSVLVETIFQHMSQFTPAHHRPRARFLQFVGERDDQDGDN